MKIISLSALQCIEKIRTLALSLFVRITVCMLLLCFPITYADNHPSADTKETADQQQAPIRITGQVRDKTGVLPGVNVQIKGTDIGTNTDENGKFSIDVPNKQSVLVVSYLGFTTREFPVGNQTVMNILLEENTQQIDEVVVVGYGVQKKANLVGAVSAVQVDEQMSSRSVQNVSSGLAGLMPGLSIIQNSGMAGKNDFSIRIRGMSTVNNSSPLIVVDGMPDVDINMLDMNDVENVSILKDAASSAVYGSRAANGVVLITTKSGKNMDRARIDVTASYAVNHPIKNYEFMADYPRAILLQQERTAVGSLRSNQLFKDGTVDQWLALGMIDPLRYPNTDWWKLTMRNGIMQRYNVSASGGNDKSNFYLSVGIYKEEGLQINNDYDRYNARFSYDYKVKKNMNVGVKFGGSWNKYTYALKDGYTDDTATNTSGFDLMYAVAGITAYDPVTGYFGGVMAYNEDAQAYNPYVYYMNGLNYQNGQQASGTMYWNWTPVKGLTAQVDYALRYYNQFRYTASMPATAYNFQTGTFGSRVYYGVNSGVANYTNTGYKTQWNGKLNYDLKIAKEHAISAMFNYSEEYWYERYQMSSRNDRIYPNLHEIDAALTDIQGTGGNSSTEGLRSYVGRLNYTAYDKYLFETNFRIDGSSKFLPGHQYGFFPSVAAGWRFTEENFIKSLTEKWLNYGKLRASWGNVGNNIGVGRYEQQQTLATRNYMLGGSITKGFVYSKMVNANLSWEKVNTTNIGLDLGFLKSRFIAELDYYDRLTVGMNNPTDLSIQLSGAYDSPRQNLGNLRNRGVEANLTWRDKIRGFNYSINLNASYNRTVLESWYGFLDKEWRYVGMPWHFVYAYQAMGIAQTWEDVYKATPQSAAPGDILVKDVNGDGRIDGNDKVAYPNYQRDMPTTNYGMTINLAYKGFDVLCLFQGSAGRKAFWLTNYNNVNFNSQRYATTWDHWYKPWRWDNRDSEWPRLGGQGRNREETTFWLDNTAFLRLKNLQAGYNLPKRLLQKIGLQNIRIFGSGENIFTITKFRGLDPEKTSNVNDAYPLIKSYSVGINISI